MQELNKSSRRSFLGKLSAASLGLTLSPGLMAKPDHPIRSTEFVSDKKFVPVMLTPFSQDGRIDYDVLAKLMDFYLASGVKGFFANCQSSEMYQLSDEERLALARFVVKRAGGAVSVVASGSFGDTLEDKAEFAKRMYHTGVNAVIMITCHFAKAEESDDVLIANFDKFFTLTDNIPMGTYECPTPYKRILTPYAFSYLLGTKRMIYHKDTTIDFPRVKAKIELAKGNRLEFYDACIANCMYSLQAGAKGMSAICGNLYPEIAVWMCNNATNPDRQTDVKYIQAQITETENILAQDYPMSAKYFLHKRGLPIELSTRIESTPLTTQQMQALDDVYKTFHGWCERIGIQPTQL
jgi:4-hydroxy-tetrahydrodipicolinate synthase